MGANTPPPPDYPEYADLWAQAQALARGPVDPSMVGALGRITARDLAHDWCTAVLGRPFTGLRAISVMEGHLLLLAFEANLDPPLPGWLVAARAAEAARQREAEREREAQQVRQAEAWGHVIRATQAVGIHFTVQTNINGERSRPRDHAAPTSNVYSGYGKATRTHLAGRALCETPGRAARLLLGEPHAGPVTCRRCFAWAVQVRAAR